MNVLAVGAHADDVELGCGGSLAKHVRRGDRVFIYTATTSGGINPYGEQIRDEKVSASDGEKSAALLGAKLIVGKFRTNELAFDDALNVDLIRVIDEKQIDMMYTHWDGDAHHDHKMLSLASIHAGRHLNRILMYRSNWFKSPNAFDENFYVDISDTWEIKENLLNCYPAEMSRTQGDWLRFNKNRAENYGMMLGVRYAEAFHCVKWSL